MKVWQFVGIVAVIGLLVAGCVSTREQMQAAGFNPAYIDGYCDGESSGKYAAGNPYTPFIKNTYRFEKDNQYQQGWTDGYSTGKSQYEALGTRRR